MSKRNLIIVIIALLAILLAGFLFKIMRFDDTRGGTPIIIKGGGDAGDLMSISGLDQYSPVGKDDINTIRVTTDQQCWFYKVPGASAPQIKLVTVPADPTVPADCHVTVEDKPLSSQMPVDFDHSTVYQYQNGEFETYKCTISSLSIVLNDLPLVPTNCSNASGSVNCLQDFKLSTVKKLEVQINYPKACP